MALQSAVHEFCNKEIVPHADEIDKNTEADLQKIFGGLGELGMLGMTIPEKYGGSELGYLDHCVVTEEISRASGAVGLSYIAHTNLCMN
jgi:isovaleryl-CoA dehydrogenase